MKKTTLFLLLSGMLAACAPLPMRPENADPGPAPTLPASRALIAKDIREHYFDPYSLRDASTTDVLPGNMVLKLPDPVWPHPIGPQRIAGWMVCTRLNSKNRMGGYTGIASTAYLIKNGAILSESEKDPVCEGQQYTPWPEMENDGEKPK